MTASRGGVFVGCVLVLLLAIDPPTSLAEQLELSIGRLNYAGFSEKQHCTATLVAPQVALTARHCLVDDDVREMHLLLGYEGDDWREHLRPASAQFTALPGDIALLCLDQASTAEPIAIADRPAERGETLLVIGYGRPNVYVANRTSCRVLHVDAQGAFLLDCPLTPGASGAPVLRATDAGYEIVGVVSATNGDASVGYGIADQDGTAPCGPALPDN